MAAREALRRAALRAAVERSQPLDLSLSPYSFRPKMQAVTSCRKTKSR